VRLFVRAKTLLESKACKGDLPRRRPRVRQPLRLVGGWTVPQILIDASRSRYTELWRLDRDGGSTSCSRLSREPLHVRQTRRGTTRASHRGCPAVARLAPRRTLELVASSLCPWVAHSRGRRALAPIRLRARRGSLVAGRTRRSRLSPGAADGARAPQRLVNVDVRGRELRWSRRPPYRERRFASRSLRRAG